MTFSAFHYISLDYLDKMSGGDRDTQKLLLDMLLKELPGAVLEMKQLFTAQNWGGLKNASHKMKSTLAFVGNAKMTLANKKILETLTSTGKGNTLTKEIKTLVDLAPKVIKELKKVYAQF